MYKLILYELKKTYYKNTTWIILISGCSVALIALLIQLATDPWVPEISSISSAYESSLIWFNPITYMVLALIIPLSATIIHADTYYNEYNNKLVYINIAKKGRYQYYVSKTIVVIITSFIVSIFPFLVNEFLCYIAFPIQDLRIFGEGIYENSYQYHINRIKFINIFYNNPVLYNFLHILLVGIYGAVMGLLSYTFSLYYNKKNVVIILFSTIFMFGLFLVASSFGLKDIVFVDYLVAKPTVENVNVNILYLFFAICTISCLFAISYKIYIKKDVL